MGKYKNWLIYLAKVTIDQAALIFCFIFAASFEISHVGGVHLSQILDIRLKLIDFFLFIIFMIFWYINLSLHGAYFSKRIVPWKMEMSEIFYAVSVGTLVLLVYAAVFAAPVITATFLLVFWLSAIILIASGRTLVRLILRQLRAQGLNINNIAIVGTNSRAVEFAREIESHPELGYRVVGFIDNEWDESIDFKNSGYPLLANFHKFPAFLRNNVIDEVIIDLPLNSFYHECLEIVDYCVKQGVVVRFISDSFYLLHNMNLVRSVIEEFNDNVLITAR